MSEREKEEEEGEEERQILLVQRTDLNLPYVYLKMFPMTVELKEPTNRAFSLTWPASMQIYWNKRKRLHNKRVQIPQDRFGTPTWPPFHCFGTTIWPP